MSTASLTWAQGSIHVPRANRLFGTDPPRDTYTIVEQMPEFKGGPTALHQYFSQHIRLPEEVRTGRVQGTVFVQIVIRVCLGLVKGLKIFHF